MSAIDPVPPPVAPTRAGPPLAVTTFVVDGVQVLELAGELDLSTIEPVREALGDEPWPTVVFDVSALEFIDSTGLNLMVRVQRTGRRVIVAEAQEAVARTIAICGLDGVLELAPDVATALR